MTVGFRDSRRLLAALVLVLAPPGASAAGPVGGALSSVTGPTALGQQTPPALTRVARDGPVRLMPRRDLSAPAAPQPVPPPAESEPPPDIQVENLGEIDPEAVGTLDESGGGLGADMWLGTPRSVIERLIGQIPAEMTSPGMRSLARRLLLSVAALPPPASAAEPGATPVSVLTQRVERLQAMGLVGPANELITASPIRGRDPALQRLRVENMLFANDVGGACGEAKRDAGRMVEPYWQRLMIFCQLLAGDTEAATFGANILAENGNFEDQAFLTLVDRLAGNADAELESLPKPTALHLAMLRSANAAIPADVLSAESPPILRTVGISPNAELEVRLKAAERAALYGAISPDRLGEVYMSVEFDPSELGNALSQAEENRTARGRALLYRAARSQSVPTAKAAVMQKAFELARADSQLSLVVPLYRQILVDLPVSAELAWFAGTASRALLALGQAEAARPWLTLLQQRAYRDQEAEAAQAGMWVLGLLAQEGRNELDDGDAMAAWLKVQQEAGAGSAESRGELALTLFTALGLQPPAVYWRRLLLAPRWRSVSMPPASYRYALRDAAANGRRGEVVLFGLLMLGRGGPASADVEVLYDALVALRTVGLEADARALALEAALASGL